MMTARRLLARWLTHDSEPHFGEGPEVSADHGVDIAAGRRFEANLNVIGATPNTITISGGQSQQFATATLMATRILIAMQHGSRSTTRRCTLSTRVRIAF
jgi:hypothetical protein